MQRMKMMLRARAIFVASPEVGGGASGGGVGTGAPAMAAFVPSSDDSLEYELTIGGKRGGPSSSANRLFGTCAVLEWTTTKEEELQGK